MNRRKWTVLLSSAVTALSLGAAAQGAVLIDGSTRNGGFESNTGTAYEQMDHWFNTSGGGQGIAIRNGQAHSGSYGAVTSLASNPSISTGHTLAAGDQFYLSFWYADNAAGGNPVIFWELYYYTDESDPGFDPTTSTNRATLFGGDITINSTAYQQFTLATTPALAADDAGIGSTLYLRFYRTTGDGQFPVIDDVVLSVIPEPASLALMGGGLILMLRRKRSA